MVKRILQITALVLLMFNSRAHGQRILEELNFDQGKHEFDYTGIISPNVNSNPVEITNTAQVEYKSSNTIQLKPGFKATGINGNGYFRATIAESKFDFDYWIAEWEKVSGNAYSYLLDCSKLNGTKKNGKDLYYMNSGLDELIAMYLATQNEEYIDKFFIITDNLIANSVDRMFSTGNLGNPWKEYKSWPESRQLDEILCFRYVTRFLRIIYEDPALRFRYQTKYTTLLDFTVENIWNKWSGEGRQVGSATNITAHWAELGMNLYVIKKNSIYSNLRNYYDLKMRPHLLDHPENSIGYYWSWNWGDNRKTQDFSHGNHDVAYIVEAFEHGDYWTRYDIARLVVTLRDVLWRAENKPFMDAVSKRNVMINTVDEYDNIFFDDVLINIPTNSNYKKVGMEGSNPLIMDIEKDIIYEIPNYDNYHWGTSATIGWITLGKYDRRLYEKLANWIYNGAGVETSDIKRANLYANMALNAKVLNEGGLQGQIIIEDYYAPNISLKSGQTNAFEEEGAGKNDFKVYPNPSNGNFTIESSKGLIINSVKVYNSLGQMVFSDNTIDNNSLNLNLTSVERGMYIVQCQIENEYYTIRMSIQ